MEETSRQVISGIPANGAVIDLQYLPCLEYFTCFLKYENVYIEANEH
jgi:hypothetical protein